MSESLSIWLRGSPVNMDAAWSPLDAWFCRFACGQILAPAHLRLSTSAQVTLGQYLFCNFYDSHAWFCSMSHDLDIRRFFQRAPREWLQRYFGHRGVLADFDWSTVRTIKVDALQDAWLSIEDDLIEEMSEDFRNIEMLATPAGKTAIIDEAAFWEEEGDVAEKLSELEDLLSCAFWTLLEKPHYWDNVLFLTAADLKPARLWRKRFVPLLGRETTGEDGRRMRLEIIEIFRRREGRGRYCEVHQVRRGDREYYFAYPQDHRQTSIEYENDGPRTYEAPV